jgi:chromosomal replication initiator protein
MSSQLWVEVVERMRARISPQFFEMWMTPIELVSWDSTTVRLRAPNSYVRWWIEKHYLEDLIQEIRGLGSAARVEFDTDSEAAIPPQLPQLSQIPMMMTASAVPEATGGIQARGSGEIRAVEATPSNPPPVIESGEGELRVLEAAKLNPRYTFDTFVAGPSNQLAFAASQAAASSYPPKYNPVFVCGGVGLGKTHLLHAIGHQQMINRPGSRVVYISSERFMNEYVQAIRTSKMHEFRRNYREGIDVLLVDDVQFLAGKDGTQDEFFHTFNALHENHKQIVLTADRKPHEISDIADRLRTRFAWGLLADIEPPGIEVRIAILRKKAASEGMQLPDDVALHIASVIKSNVRELEGALIRLSAYASFSGKAIDLEFAQKSLGAVTRAPEMVTVDGIIKIVAGYFNLKVTDIKSERRHKSVATPRAIAMYLARAHTKDSYPDLARAFGGKHHTTVLSAVQKIADRLRDDAGLRGQIAAIEQQIAR